MILRFDRVGIRIEHVHASSAFNDRSSGSFLAVAGAQVIALRRTRPCRPQTNGTAQAAAEVGLEIGRLRACLEPPHDTRTEAMQLPVFALEQFSITLPTITSEYRPAVLRVLARACLEGPYASRTSRNAALMTPSLELCYIACQSEPSGRPLQTTWTGVDRPSPRADETCRPGQQSWYPPVQAPERLWCPPFGTRDAALAHLFSSVFNSEVSVELAWETALLVLAIGAEAVAAVEGAVGSARPQGPHDVWAQLRVAAVEGAVGGARC